MTKPTKLSLTRRSLVSLSLFVPLSACGASQAPPSAIPPTAPPIASEGAPEAELATAAVVAFDSEASMQRLSRSQHKRDFFSLANHFETQQNLSMCGPTSSVIVLNTLRADRSEGKPHNLSLFPEKYREYLPANLLPVFERYTQGIFLQDPKVSAVKDPADFYGRPDAEGKRDPGLQLRQLHAILSAHGVKAELRVVDDTLSVDSVREELAANLARPGDYVLINYYRPTLEQKGGGHISPLGAYDQVSDSFLILDVNANHGKTWVWVQTETLVASMRTKDIAENRGYVLVSEGAGEQAP